jgi:hypothetical protein
MNALRTVLRGLRALLVIGVVVPIILGAFLWDELPQLWQEETS